MCNRYISFCLDIEDAPDRVRSSPEIFSLSHFPSFSFTTITLTMSSMSSSPLMFSSDLGSLGSSDLYSRSSLGLFSFSDSGLSHSGNQNAFDRRLLPPDNGPPSRPQDASNMFSASSMVCALVSLRHVLISSKASGASEFWRFLFWISVRQQFHYPA